MLEKQPAVLLARLVACALNLFFFFPLAQPVPGLKKPMGTGLAWFGFPGTGGYSWLPAVRLAPSIPRPSPAVSGTSAVFLAVLCAPA